MDVDRVLEAFNRHQAEVILIGGMNFFLSHQPVTTFDVDLWMEDSPANHLSVHNSLVDLQAEVSFSPQGDDWTRVADLPAPGWLARSPVFCLTTPHGAVDMFRFVPGLEAGYAVLREECPVRHTPTGIRFRSLSDRLMIRCQESLPEPARRLDRIRALQRAIAADHD